ncbi:sugar phosphate isomerase/epimerase, partial [Streptomyces botrytidirepellens]
PARRGEPQTPLGTGDVDAPAAVRAAGPGLRWHVAEIDITDHDPFELLAGNAAQLAESGLSRWS